MAAPDVELTLAERIDLLTSVIVEAAPKLTPEQVDRLRKLLPASLESGQSDGH